MNPFQINRDRSIDQDKVFLVDKLFHPIRNGEIYPVSDLQIVANLNSNWECRFTVYRETDGVPCPLWDQITDFALVKIENKGIFELEAPITDEAGTYKQCSGKSICEAETSQTLMTLEINTEDDIARESETDPTAAYYEEFPTVFYRNVADTSVFDSLGNTTHAAKLRSLSREEKIGILRRSSLLHRVFSEMPEYLENITENNIDDSLKNLQYTFSWSDTSIYDICQNIAEEIQCIFIFDPFRRSFQVRDLKDHCEIDHCRDIQDGICPVCRQNGTTQKIASFGKYSGVEIDTCNLAETITLSGNKDSVKNYFKVEGADDIITDRISNRLIGNGYIWKTGALQRSQMSSELIAALDAREQMMTAEYPAGSKYQNIQDEYNKLWDQWNALESQKLDYQSGMMPSPEMADQNAEYVFQYLFGVNGKISYACASNCYQTETQIADSVMNYAKLLSPTNHTIEYSNLSYDTTKWHNQDVVNSISFQVHIYSDGQYIENNGKQKYADEYLSSEITLKVSKGYDVTDTYSKDGETKTVYSTDYYNYLKRLIDTANAKSDITDEVITFDPITPVNIAPDEATYNGIKLKSSHYSKYCYSRLDSFCKAYEACSAVVAELNDKIPSDTTGKLQYLKPDGNVGNNIKDDLLGKYQKYSTLLSERMKWLQEQIKGMEESQASLMNSIHEIKESCDMEHCLTKYAEEHHIARNLWHELCSFRRQDTYRNDNFFGEGVDDAQLMKNVEDLLKRAEEEIESACNISYSASATISNLLTLPEFEPFWDQFTLGNYIHMVIDHQIHTMRLISINYDYSDLSRCSVEFSDVIRKSKNKTEEIADILSQASSLASSAKTTARQAEQGAAAKLSVDVIKNDALNLANSRIVTADDQNFVIDKYGITGKYIDPISGEVSDEQIRIINNLLCFTDDNWQHTKTALGKISYINPETKEYETKYGLIADTVIGNLILGEKLIISDQNGYVRIDGSGIELDGGAITWKNQINQDAVISKNTVEGLPEYIENTNTFKQRVRDTLGVTTITSDSVISPKIGGGYLYIVDGNNSITLNPHANAIPNGIQTGSDNMFEIISNNNKVLAVDKQGNLTVSGTIYATDGEFTGTVNATDGTFTGTVNATDGTFTGAVLLKGGYLTTNATRNTYNNQTPGLTFDKNGIGGYSNSSMYFNLTSNGKLTAAGVNITGEICATKGYIGGTNGWTISNGAIHNGCNSLNSTKKGIYIGTDGICMNGSYYDTKLQDGVINMIASSNTLIDSIDSGGLVIIGKQLDDDTSNVIAGFSSSMRSSFADFTNLSARRSVVGYIHARKNPENTETGFYLINSENTITGSFIMNDNSNTSALNCEHITTNKITLNAEGYLVSNHNNPLNYIGGDPNNILYVGHSGYTKQIFLEASTHVRQGTLYIQDSPVSTSDIRLKTDISEIDEKEVNFILGLCPKKYKLKAGTSGRYHYGFAAQDVDKLMQNTIGDVGLLVKQEMYLADDDRHVPIDFRDDTTFYYGLRYEEFISPMIKTIQKLNDEIQQLKEQIRRQ